MKQILSTMAVTLLIAGIGFTQVAQETKQPQDSKGEKTAAAEDAQRVATGEITKIDAKKKILTVREASIDRPSDSARRDSGQTPNRRGGTGGGRRRGGVGYPGGGGGGRRAPATPQGKEFKVTVTDQTAIKDKVTTIGFDLLRIGDRISIQGLPKGKGPDLQATQITVN